MFTKNNFKELYEETTRLDPTNKLLTLANSEVKNIPYSEYSKVQIRFFDSPGKNGANNISLKFLMDMKALLLVYDITNESSFRSIKNYIEVTKNFFTKNKKKLISLGNNIKQPDFFKDIPIIIVGNKLDLNNQRKVDKFKVEEFLMSIKEKNNFSLINNYDISAKDNKGITDIFQDIIFYYFKRKIQFSILRRQTKIFKKNDIQKKEKEGKKEESVQNKKPSMEKTMQIFEQILDKYKQNSFLEVTLLKKENEMKKKKNKELEEKIESLNNDINNEKKIIKEKIDVCENKNNELEKELKSKIEEIEQLKQKVNELILFKQDITLKFKISDENAKDEISINTKGGTKMSDVLSMLYGLCPYVKNLDIKGFCLEGNENEKIDEMKSVNENKLVNGSLIVLIV